MSVARIGQLRQRVGQLREEITAKEAQLSERERVNIETALHAQAVVTPLEQRLAGVSGRCRAAEEDERAALAELTEAEEESRLIRQSGHDHEADLQSQVNEASAKAARAEQASADLAAQVEQEVLSLLTQEAVFERRRAELSRKLDALTLEKRAS